MEVILSDELDLILKKLVHDAFELKHPVNSFVAGETQIPVTGKVFGEKELEAATRASLDFWLTAGPYTKNFERSLAGRVGVRHALMVNSGSSANLLAISA